MKKNLYNNTERQNFGFDSLAGSSSQLLRISFYIDGFNLYHSLKDIKNVNINNSAIDTIDNYNEITWVDLKKLCSLYAKNKILQDIYFFTAFPKHRKIDQQYRHKIYIQTLKNYLKINVIEGKFTTYPKMKEVKCDHCKSSFDYSYKETTEKQTDTNIVAQILIDAFFDKADIFAIITNDSDIIPAINGVKMLNKRIKIITPPSVKYISTGKSGAKKVQSTLFLSEDIKKALAPSYPDRITIKQLINCLLPDKIPNLFDDKGNSIQNPYK